MPISVRLGLVAMIACLFGCVNTPLSEGVSISRMPMGIGFGVFDLPCKDVKNIYLPERLQELDIPFEWTDKNETKFAVGPFVEEITSGNISLKLRQTYFLQISCGDELLTTISGEVILEELGKTGEWVWINDPVTIENQSMRFMQKLDL